jgi:hypothetical protein
MNMILIYTGSMLKSLDFSNHPRLGQQICMALGTRDAALAKLRDLVQWL